MTLLQPLVVPVLLTVEKLLPSFWLAVGLIGVHTHIIIYYIYLFIWTALALCCNVLLFMHDYMMNNGDGGHIGCTSVA